MVRDRMPSPWHGSEAWLFILTTSFQHCTESLKQSNVLKSEVKEIQIGKEELQNLFAGHSFY